MNSYVDLENVLPVGPGARSLETDLAFEKRWPPLETEATEGPGK